MLLVNTEESGRAKCSHACAMSLARVERPPMNIGMVCTARCSLLFSNEAALGCAVAGGLSAAHIMSTG